MDENLAAARLTLTEEDLRGIALAQDEVKIEGDRYPPQLARAVDR